MIDNMEPQLVPNTELDLKFSPVVIPTHLKSTVYDESCYPGSARKLNRANCQRYAYDFLDFYGRKVPDFRSSELWSDTLSTTKVDIFEPFDLLLFNQTPDSWGAHVGVFLGHNWILHLSRSNNLPKIETLSCLLKRPSYIHLIGGKRCK